MKTAISIPDDDFERFERLAERQGMNRSEFYRAAAEHYANELEGNRLTELMNEAIEFAGDLDEEDRAWLALGARTVLKETEW